ncbi:MAG: PilN domain-containing protein [Deltaproteobacteria bacterium]|nr:PilN domain-containing protein [Deltaproteobacteria bacterium]
MDTKSFFHRIVKADFADALGIALRGDVVSVAHVRKRLNSVRVIELASARLGGPSEAHLAEAASFLRRWVADNAVEPTRIAIAVDRSVTFLGTLPIPASAAANAGGVVGYELDRLIPVPADALYWSHLVRPVGTVGERVAVTVVAAPRLAVEEAAALAAEAGLPLSAVTAEPLALSDYVAFSRHPLAALLTRAGTRDYLTLTTAGVLASSHHLDTRTGSRAEAVAREVETALPEHSGEAPVRACQSPTEPGEVALTDLVAGDFFPIGCRPTESEIVAVGAALGQLGESKTPINLLPEAMVHASTGLGLRELALSGAVIVMALVLVATMTAKNLAIDAALASEVARLEPMVEQTLRRQDKNQETLEKVARLEKRSRSRVLTYMKAITELVPPSAYLTTFRFREDRIEVDGIAGKASELIAILEASPYFANVDFTAPTTKYLADQERFSLRMRLEE